MSKKSESMLVVEIPTGEPLPEFNPSIIMSGAVGWIDGSERLLRGLLPVVNAIHGGCAQCRAHWMHRANAILEADTVPWRFAPKTDSLGHEAKGPDGQPAELVIVAAE